MVLEACVIGSLRCVPLDSPTSLPHSAIHAYTPRAHDGHVAVTALKPSSGRRQGPPLDGSTPSATSSADGTPQASRLSTWRER